jgi:hypothetical protein
MPPRDYSVTRVTVAFTNTNNLRALKFESLKLDTTPSQLPGQRRALSICIKTKSNGFLDNKTGRWGYGPRCVAVFS